MLLFLNCRQKKLISADHQSVLKANDELYEEAQRLSDIEAKWQLEKEQLEGELAKLSRQLEDLDKTSSVSQVLAENHSHTVEQAWSQTHLLRKKTLI